MTYQLSHHMGSCKRKRLMQETSSESFKTVHSLARIRFDKCLSHVTFHVSVCVFRYHDIFVWKKPFPFLT